LIKGVRALQEKIVQAGMLVPDKDLEYLELWLTQHIISDDMRLGTYLSEVM
jgi:hemerythrin